MSGAGDGADGFKVLVDSGDYRLRNRGDIAMMVMTVERLRQRWPNARIGVLTEEPGVLRAVLPDAEPVIVHSGGYWGRGGFAGRLEHATATKLTGPASVWWRAASEVPKARLREAKSWAVSGVHALTGAEFHSNTPPRPPLPAAVEDAALVIALGGGYLNDNDQRKASRTLDLLERARALGIPTAMLGQGLGPLTDPRLRERAAAVLPDVDVIAVREGLRGPRLLADLGVAADRVLVTGDDAIEFSYRMRRPEIGTDLGICLRAGDSTKISDSARDTLGAAVRAGAAEFDATLAPLILSENDSEDRRATLPLLSGATRTRPVIGRAGTAAEVARRVARCRVLVTSAYHLAVFALSQGIPAIGVTASQYYDDKFYGLADMFGAGLRVVHLDSTDLERELAHQVRDLWVAAPDLRDTLQHKAVEQIDAGRAGLERVFRLVED
ncbi:polysaccharide pyruvyl transferase family protein [Nocardia uniformis]|uniref:Polysaccharide pyruvyl transferase family protein n=1 Tax=Nocardia uniformis TaxID=53432 RepID=A0A849C376_9NOCA|nr:polysaccharide pyruvyl transferase family protein [Nocardia uniformis]NNH70775.1 polysaccharide pyruvyl transferase family protein [Nocardia uniformis]